MSLRERRWHFWVSGLVISAMAGAMCTIAAVPVFWLVALALKQFGLDLDLYLSSYNLPTIFRVIWVVFTLGFFVWGMATHTRRPDK